MRYCLHLYCVERSLYESRLAYIVILVSFNNEDIPSISWLFQYAVVCWQRLQPEITVRKSALKTEFLQRIAGFNQDDHQLQPKKPHAMVDGLWSGLSIPSFADVVYYYDVMRMVQFAWGNLFSLPCLWICLSVPWSPFGAGVCMPFVGYARTTKGTWKQESRAIWDHEWLYFQRYGVYIDFGWPSH